jgi:hypothetical protein
MCSRTPYLGTVVHRQTKGKSGPGLAASDVTAERLRIPGLSSVVVPAKPWTILSIRST